MRYATGKVGAIVGVLDGAQADSTSARPASMNSGRTRTSLRCGLSDSRAESSRLTYAPPTEELRLDDACADGV